MDAGRTARNARSSGESIHHGTRNIEPKSAGPESDSLIRAHRDACMTQHAVLPVLTWGNLHMGIVEKLRERRSARKIEIKSKDSWQIVSTKTQPYARRC